MSGGEHGAQKPICFFDLLQVCFFLIPFDLSWIWGAALPEVFAFFFLPSCREAVMAASSSTEVTFEEVPICTSALAPASMAADSASLYCLSSSASISLVFTIVAYLLCLAFLLCILRNVPNATLPPLSILLMRKSMMSGLAV